MMKRILAVAALAAVVVVGGTRPADARVSIGIGIPGVVFGAPVYGGPAYYPYPPPPHYYSSYYGPTYYYGPPVVGGAYFGGRFGHRHRWGGGRHWGGHRGR
jgi:hypothetical protein